MLYKSIIFQSSGHSTTGVVVTTISRPVSTPVKDGSWVSELDTLLEVPQYQGPPPKTLPPSSVQWSGTGCNNRASKIKNTSVNRPPMVVIFELVLICIQ